MWLKRPSGKMSIKNTPRRVARKLHRDVADEAADPVEAVVDEEVTRVEPAEEEQDVDVGLLLLPRLHPMPNPRQNRKRRRPPILLLLLQFLRVFVRRRVLGVRKRNRQLQLLLLLRRLLRCRRQIR